MAPLSRLTKGPAKGSGLGLAISYSLIRQMQGTITLQSGVGRGTQFVIYLPELPAAGESG
ncbi:MAG: ATP-binding protein [Chloroflexaceae bacterium]|nr:ATP-binding protein [Chloroflexaceae bacterium]